MIAVTLVGPDNSKSVVTISGNATVRGVVIAYDLFCRIVKRNGTCVPPFTTRVADGDSLTVEELKYQD